MRYPRKPAWVYCPSRMALPSSSVNPGRSLMRAVMTLALVLALLGMPATRPDVQRLYDAVRTLVRRHYPEATSHRLGNTIHFEQKTRVFLVHLPLKSGEWQDPVEMRGPEAGGIYGVLT